MNAVIDLVEVRVPDMGNFKDVAVIDVLVKPGESIEAEAPLVTLETEKATMDVPSTVGGVVEKIHVTKGGTVSTGDVIVTVRAAGQGAGDQAAGGSPPQPPAAQPGASGQAGSPGQSSTGGSSGAGAPTSAGTVGVKGGGDGRGTASGRAGATAGVSAQGSGGAGVPPGGAGASSVGAGAAAANETPFPPINEPGFSRVHAGPSVRKFARELGVDLTRVHGGGFKGRVTHEDVKGFVKGSLAHGSAGTGGASAPGATGASGSGGTAGAASGAGAPVGAVSAAGAPSSVSAAGGAAAKGPGSGLPAVPVIDFSLFGPIETKPLSRIQKISGPRLHASWVNIPHVTQFDEADITELEEVRNKLKQKASQEGIKLTPLAFIVRACVRALQEFPLFNSSLDPSGTKLVLKRYIHVGFAADTPNGLVVPVIHEANRKDIYKTARELGELSEKARAGKLSPADMQGGCFTISSLGGIGGTAFTPIINAPEVAILGISRSAMRPVFREGGFVPRLILPLSLSYDHRVIDGASAARFTTFLAQTLADPHGLTEAVP
jgi:pyruvate dehydrogenase E2 component (dihydrolipoamide acetyltransferase)